MSEEEEDEEQYSFEYSSDDEPDRSAAEVALQNSYYAAKELRQSDQGRALEAFGDVVAAETRDCGAPGEWGFRALKQCVKLHWRRGEHGLMMERYRQLLRYCSSDAAVTRNASEKGLNSILDLVSASSTAEGSFSPSDSALGADAGFELLTSFYQTTLKVLQEARSDRLWFKTSLKLGYLYFHANRFGELNRLLKELHRAATGGDVGGGSGQRSIPLSPQRAVALPVDSYRRGAQLLDVYALQIQMYTAQKDDKKLKSLYQRSLQIRAALPHPVVNAVIRESGGKMHMREQAWEKARTDFFEAFKNYDEAGDVRRLRALKYLVLANMLSVESSRINPFDSQETKPYENDPEIRAMTLLVGSYVRNDLAEFEAVLRENRESVMDDAFISLFINRLLEKIRTERLERMIAPYTRVSLGHLASMLALTESEIERLLVKLILDDRLAGRIDQVSRVLVLERFDRRGCDGSVGPSFALMVPPPSRSTASLLSRRRGGPFNRAQARTGRVRSAQSSKAAGDPVSAPGEHSLRQDASSGGGGAAAQGASSAGGRPRGQDGNASRKYVELDAWTSNVAKVLDVVATRIASLESASRPPRSVGHLFY